VLTKGASGTFAPVAESLVGNHTIAHPAGIRITVLATQLTVLAVEAIVADAVVATLADVAVATVLARTLGTKVNLVLTVATHVAGSAVAVIVVDQLDTVQGAGIGAGIAQALIDVTLAAGTHESWLADALEASYPIDATAIIVARSWFAVIFVDLTDDANGAGRTAAAEVHHAVVAGATILAGIRGTIVDVQFAVLTLEALTTAALVGTNEIPAGSAILTWLRLALVDLLLAVAARISLGTVADMAVPVVLARSVVAQLPQAQSLPVGCILAGDGLDIT